MPLWYHRTDDYKWIHGSIRQDLEPDERGVWADLLALAGLTREPRRGYIERSEGIPYPKNVLICMLNISEDLFNRTVSKCKTEGRLQVFKDGTMFITNWGKYNNVEEWHKKKEMTAGQKEAKRISIEHARQTRKTIDNIAQGATQSLNNLNGVVNSFKDKVENLKTLEG